mmetsp:Transcript_25025/g.45282  ORF Transcript_25025/g.45282 Transcript_25025/m.45282 type:complete len:161 (-) Transcript_25025:348-830(-)
MHTRCNSNSLSILSHLQKEKEEGADNRSSSSERGTNADLACSIGSRSDNNSEISKHVAGARDGSGRRRSGGGGRLNTGVVIINVSGVVIQANKSVGGRSGIDRDRHGNKVGGIGSNRKVGDADTDNVAYKGRGGQNSGGNSAGKRADGEVYTSGAAGAIS